MRRTSDEREVKRGYDVLRAAMNSTASPYLGAAKVKVIYRPAKLLIIRAR